MLVVNRRLFCAIWIGCLIPLSLVESVSAQLVPPLTEDPSNTPRYTSKGWTAPTEEESKQFINQVIEALTVEKFEDYDKLLDWDLLLAVATRKTPRTPFQKSFTTDFLKSVRGAEGMGSKILQAVQQGGSYTAIRIREQGPFQRILFRFLLPENRGLNYHEYVVTKTDTGKVLAVDMYVFTQGLLMSDFVRRGYLFAAAKEPNITNGLDDAEKFMVKHAAALGAISNASNRNEAAIVRQLFPKLPAEAQKDKTALLNYFAACRTSSESDMKSALGLIETNFGKESIAGIQGIDTYVLLKQWEDSLKAIELLDSFVGGDPYLKIMRANVLEQSGDLQSAKALVQKALAQDENMGEAYISLLGFSLVEKDFASTLSMLMELDRRFQMEFADLTTVPEYQGFVASPQFKSWQKYLAEKKPESTGPIK
jgi:hypothetical protein